MADDIDRAQENMEIETAAAIIAARKPIPEGVPGKCRDCLEYSQRLVGGRCAPCRDNVIR